ncbi:hypothetical protein PDESU_03374 [Pontiella desulfatans]|uniref:Oligosaccharide repeat unit polymerase n=1 Tax=Pontiella desulfatans TaxID=2750659 RepID=A0A6C2U4I0_PONDE|nr:hypothetical protein [Pontiella desulfatans]VGO14805.1 hypothetical protein PDESU_03374 [Pontiella desulfatans]
MDLFSLVLYAAINAAMVVLHLMNKNRIYEFPFWAGLIALGWLLPQAVGGYRNIDAYPDQAYSSAMLFASLCTLAMWGGHAWGLNHGSAGRASWLSSPVEVRRLVPAGSLLCFAGFFFQWKLNTLPDELKAQTQWSGATVKYLFLASVFHFGFLTLWLVYIRQRKVFAPRLLLFIIPSLLLLLKTAVLGGRRAGMMNLASYMLTSLWFVRGWIMPRWLMVSGLTVGLILVNAIGHYRSIMGQKDVSLGQRLENVAKSDLASESENVMKRGGAELNNYIFVRQIYAEEKGFDFGVYHWNMLVFNFVPAQIVGRALKESLIFPLSNYGYSLAAERYGHRYYRGTTSTGYNDSFKSFGWLGFIKFGIIGWMMGVLYRHAVAGDFLGQLLYAYLLSVAMHAISHSTHAILVSKWVYFFLLGFPALWWAKVRVEGSEG